MTETAWNSCTDPHAMLEWLRTSGRGSDRKLRLFAVACAGRMWRLSWDEWNVNAVNVAERHADGEVPDEDLRLVYEGTEAEYPARPGEAPVYEAADPDAYRAAWRTAEAAAYYLALEGGSLSPVPGRQGEEELHLAGLLRCIIGNPFRTVSLDLAVLAWQGGTISRLAAACYEERDPPDARLRSTHLAILADALEEAGYDDGEVLAHLRSPGPHARGCYVVDLLLGKQ